MEKEYRCAIIGQHPMRFPWGFDEEDTQCRRMKLELAQCIMELRQCGVTEFQVACDPGVGLYAGEIVNITKQNDEAMRLVCVIPFEEQATKWTPQLRERYFDMLADCTDLSCVDYAGRIKTKNKQFHDLLRICDEVTVVCQEYTPSCFMRRNRYMAVKSQRVIAVYDGRDRGGTLYTMRYAHTLEKEVRVIEV